MMKSLLSMKDVDKKDIANLISLAKDMKKNSAKYSASLKGKTLLMIFEKPSLRTRLSFDVGMKQLGGDAIVVDTGQTPFGTKESIEDTAKTCSRYVDCIMARLFSHEKLVRLSEAAGIPIINGLTDDEHPAQILSDLLTIAEKKGKLQGLKFCYLGDGNNNVTHSLLIGCAMMGMDIAVGCPKGLQPNKEIVGYARRIASGSVTVTADPQEAISDADVVYTDSWMSYHIDPSIKEARARKLMPYQVNRKIAAFARKDFIFMHCLPASRGCEQTAEIIDGKHSVVFDQAENRLHMQKALLYMLLKGNGKK
ncbi:MAG TPA: ornithine carbamoyltransferase [Planctomycetia bacterium]|nr:ornithine carbamoyltransferase [Planctomycetia bacterium]